MITVTELTEIDDDDDDDDDIEDIKSCSGTELVNSLKSVSLSSQLIIFGTSR